MGHGIALFGEKSEAVVELRGLTISVYLPRSKSRAVAKMCDAADKPCWTKPPGEAVDCCSRPIGDCNLYAFLRKLWPEVALTLVIWYAISVSLPSFLVPTYAWGEWLNDTLHLAGQLLASMPEAECTAASKQPPLTQPELI